jgi:hypothetical protein
MAQFTLAAGPAAGEPVAQPMPAGNLAGSAVTTGATIGTGPGLNPFSGQHALSPLGDQGRWSQSLGERVLMMSDGGMQTARIRLQPEHLGTLDVRIQIEDDTARVFFNAPHGQTREALEAALPKLREMFEANGMHLVQADVSADRQRQDAGDEPWTRGSTDPYRTPMPNWSRSWLPRRARRSYPTDSSTSGAAIQPISWRCPINRCQSIGFPGGRKTTSHCF